MDDDLDRRVGEHGRQRSGLEPGQRVEHPHVLVDDDLHEAEQRPVPPLGHELRVEPEPSLPRARAAAIAATSGCPSAFSQRSACQVVRMPVDS